MGRLFWKIFGGFLLTLLLMVGGIIATLVIREEALRNDDALLAQGPHSTIALRITWMVFHHGGEPALRSMLTDWLGMPEG